MSFDVGCVNHVVEAQIPEEVERGLDDIVTLRRENEAQFTEKVQHRAGKSHPSHSSYMTDPVSATRRNSHLSGYPPLRSITTMHTSIHRKLESLRSSFYNSTPAYAMHTTPLYAYINIQTEFLALMLSSVVAVLFGAIHCAAWGWTFKTEAERTIWRTGAVIITAAPCVVVLRAATRAWSKSHRLKERSRPSQTQTPRGAEIVHEPRPSEEHSGGAQAENTAPLVEKAEAELAEARRLTKTCSAPQILLWIIVLLVPVYTAARLALLTEALVALRALTPETRAQVDWVQFIPHI